MGEQFDAAGFNQDVGRRLTLYRKRAKLTQQAVADVLGLPRATYANHETGRQRIGCDILWRAAVLFDTKVQMLMPERLRRPTDTGEGPA